MTNLLDRSMKPINNEDLKRLANIAKEDRIDLFSRLPVLGALYKDRMICTALCQGAALHYVDGKNGIKDFDVWNFFREHPQRSFPYRILRQVDFGYPKFGKTPGKPDYIGRCVDLIGRSIPYKSGQSPVQAIRNYLMNSNNMTPRLLAKKAVIILEPEELFGKIVWPVDVSPFAK